MCFWKSKLVIVAACLSFTAVGCVGAEPPSGTYDVRTFRFVPVDQADPEGGPIPSIWIDTNTKLSGLYGGTLTSSLPCAVRLDYTDNQFEMKSLVVSDVRVTYDDRTKEPAVKELKLPIDLPARRYGSVNSVSGGRVVRSTTSVLSGEIPGVVTRAEPFRLKLQGHFLDHQGEKTPFVIKQSFRIEKENATKHAAEVLQDR